MIRERAFRAVLEPRVARALEQDFTRDVVQAIISEAFADYAGRAPALRERSFGGAAMVHLAALTIGMYDAVLRRTESAASAREITSKATWAIYATLAWVPGTLAKIGKPAPPVQLRRATDAFRKFPFGPPAYQMEDIGAGPDVVAFDVRRCPVAEYFESEDLTELCVDAWCDLDFRLARAWGATLKRERTVAGGGGVCDFRWQVRSGEHHPTTAPA